MGTVRDEHARQTEAQAFQNDTDLMEPSFDSGARMTDQGTIPAVEDEFTAGGPTVSDRAYGSYVMVTASTLNVRSSPSKDSKANVIGKLHRGTKVEVRGNDGDWVKISFQGGTAYVHGDYVTPIDTRPSAEASEEAMRLFREVNGEEVADPSQARGTPPSPEASAEVMRMFREVNGDEVADPSQVRGKPPSPEASAEVMQMFREVNGDGLMQPDTINVNGRELDPE